jgi:hypothetical protein
VLFFVPLIEVLLFNFVIQYPYYYIIIFRMIQFQPKIELIVCPVSAFIFNRVSVAQAHEIDYAALKLPPPLTQKDSILVRLKCIVICRRQ